MTDTTSQNHPRNVLNTQDINLLRESSAEIEQILELTPDVLNLIYKRRWLQMMVSRTYGGVEYELPATLKFIEAISWADGNVGWVVNLGAGANLFSGYLDKEVALRIFNSPKTWVAGSSFPSVVARKSGSGYILNGVWKRASGSNHATHYDGNTVLHDENNKPITDSEGKPVMKAFIFEARPEMNHRNWDSFGLKSTSTNELHIRDLFVPTSQMFDLSDPSKNAVDPIYQFPFMELSILTTTAVCMGIVGHYKDLFESFWASKEKVLAEMKDTAKIKAAKNIIEPLSLEFSAARQEYYTVVQKVWEPYPRKQIASKEDRNKVTTVSRRVAAAARAYVFGVYPLFGMAILGPKTEANRVFRDACVAFQHFLVGPLFGI